jgi:NAD(P)-dependent dehydrogenase (short-subunit alcohol dehydrogenase family)
MENKICLITGANSGIGKETAIALAKQGMHIIMVCRNPETALSARQEVLAASTTKKVDLYLCDLAIQDQVTDLARKIRLDYDRIDVLINNAGLILQKRKTTPDGLEATMAVNHFSPFLLTNLLLDLVRRSAEGRIINVSSMGHKFSGINFNDLQSASNYSSFKVYAMSKLANILFTRKLAQILEPEGITVNTLHPGAVSSNFGSGNGNVANLVLKIIKPFMISASQGAKTSIFLASSPKVKGITGIYFNKSMPAKPSVDALSTYNADRLWEESVKITRLHERLRELETERV